MLQSFDIQIKALTFLKGIKKTEEQDKRQEICQGFYTYHSIDKPILQVCMHLMHVLSLLTRSLSSPFLLSTEISFSVILTST